LQDLVARLAELVAFDTRNPGGREAALVAHLEAALAKHAPDELVVRELPRGRDDGHPGAYVFARWGAPSILLNAHVDTVAVGPGWTGDPFTLRQGEGRVTALGAADTKGAIAAALEALDVVHASGHRPRDCAVLFSGDEEQGGACMEAFLKSEQARGIASAIACEPTSCRVGHRHRGILALEIDARSEGGHSSRADALPAPLLELSRIATAIGEWGERKRAEGPAGFTGMCTNIAELRGGVGFNIIPPQATLVVSLRPPPGASLDALSAELTAIAMASCRPTGSVTVRQVLSQPALATRDLAAFRSALGAACDAPIDLGFWTEAALLERDGINAVVYGPGDIAQAHGADEWVTVQDLERARDAFAALFVAGRAP
jgi:acetylornithine deacetylase